MRFPKYKDSHNERQSVLSFYRTALLMQEYKRCVPRFSSASSTQQIKHPPTTSLGVVRPMMTCILRIGMSMFTSFSTILGIYDITSLHVFSILGPTISQV